MASLRHDLGIAFMAAGRNEEALRAFAETLRLDPRIPSAHFYSGQILENLGRQDQAMEAFEAAVALAPDLTEAHERLAPLYLLRRMHDKSAASFRKVAGAAKDEVTARIAEAGALDASGALEEAIALMRATVEAHPEHGAAHANLGHAGRPGREFSGGRPALRPRRRDGAGHALGVVGPRGQQEVHAPTTAR